VIRYVSKSAEQKVPTAVHCFSQVTRRMADDMRELAFAGQNVSPETLASRGYSADVVKRIAPKAIALARRQSTRQIAEV